MTSPNREVPTGAYGPQGSGLSSLATMTQESVMQTIRQPVVDAFAKSKSSYWQNMVKEAERVVNGIADALLSLFDPDRSAPEGFEAITFAAGEMFAPVQDKVAELEGTLTELNGVIDEDQESLSETLADFRESLGALGSQLSAVESAVTSVEDVAAEARRLFEENIPGLIEDLRGADSQLEALESRISLAEDSLADATAHVEETAGMVVEATKVFRGEPSEFQDFQNNWNHLVSKFVDSQSDWNLQQEKLNEMQAEFNAGQTELNKRNLSFSEAMSEFMGVQTEFNEQTVEFQQTQAKTNELYQAMFEDVEDGMTLLQQVSSNNTKVANTAAELAKVSYLRNNASFYIDLPPGTYGPTIKDSRYIDFTGAVGDMVGVELIRVGVASGDSDKAVLARLGSRGVWDVDVSLMLSAHPFANDQSGAVLWIVVLDENAQLVGQKFQRRMGGGLLEFDLHLTVPALRDGWMVGVGIRIVPNRLGIKYHRAPLVGANFSEWRFRQVSGDPRDVQWSTSEASSDPVDLGQSGG